jgi:imidazolonepropionase-like amidohydrolase
MIKTTFMIMNSKLAHHYFKTNLKYFAAIFFVLLTSWTSAQTDSQKTPVLVIKNTNVVDVLKGAIIPNVDVVIKDKLIYFVGKSSSKRIPSNAVVINGKGKYVSPGLWDMHFHLCWDKNNDTLLFPALLKNGITGIRDMGGDLKIMNGIKTKNKSVVPEIYGAGPIIDGNPPVYTDFSLPVDDRTIMKAVLDSLKNNGADFFKTYSLIKEKQLRDISTYCAINKMTFAGHLSEYIDPGTSISLGQKSIEHLNRLDIIWESSKNKLDDIARLMIANNTFLCPTLITYQLKTRVRDPSIVNSSYTKYISASLASEWQSAWKKRFTRHTELANWDELNKTFTSQMQLVNHLHKKGIMILAGSDFAGMPYVYPGIGLHQELILLTQAGLSNYEVMKTATINPAIFMSRQNLYGSVSVGKYADMLILEKNPLDNINNLQTIKLVIVKGEIYQDVK